VGQPLYSEVGEAGALGAKVTLVAKPSQPITFNNPHVSVSNRLPGHFSEEYLSGTLPHLLNGQKYFGEKTRILSWRSNTTFNF